LKELLKEVVPRKKKLVLAFGSLFLPVVLIGGALWARNAWAGAAIEREWQTTAVEKLQNLNESCRQMGIRLNRSFVDTERRNPES
jgi:hypothetical protein